jgi:hypothetical protein
MGFVNIFFGGLFTQYNNIVNNQKLIVMTTKRNSTRPNGFYPWWPF